MNTKPHGQTSPKSFVFSLTWLVVEPTRYYNVEYYVYVPALCYLLLPNDDINLFLLIQMRYKTPTWCIEIGQLILFVLIKDIIKPQTIVMKSK